MNIFQTSAVAICVAAASAATPAQAQDWQKSFSSTFGELRLKQVGDYVYGDYKDGTIEGIVDRPSRMLRGIFRNPDGTSGLVELKFDWRNQSFAGSWQWLSSDPPRHDAGPASQRWTGSRAYPKNPAVRNFTRTPSRETFINSAPKKYRSWIEGFSTDHPLGWRFPKLHDYPASFVPRGIEVDIRQIGYLAGVTPLMQGAARNAFIFGSYGVYFYCETESGLTPIAPMFGKQNRVFDKARDGAVRISWMQGTEAVDVNQGIRRFPLDQQCLNKNGARFMLQVQTNLRERNAVPALDTVFGYQAFNIYLDQIPNSSMSDFKLSTTSIELNATGPRENIPSSFLSFKIWKREIQVGSVFGSVKFFD